MVFVVPGAVIVCAIGVGAHFLLYHGGFDNIYRHVCDVLSGRMTVAHLVLLTVRNTIKLSWKHMLWVAITIAAISSDAPKAWCYRLANETDLGWVVDTMSVKIKQWEDANNNVFYQQRMKKGLIESCQRMIKQFTGSLVNETYIHRTAELKLAENINRLWDESDVFGMLVYGHEGSGKRTTLVEVLLQMSVSYDIFGIDSQYYWFAIISDWILRVTTFGQVRIDFYYEYVQTRSDKRDWLNSALFNYNEKYPATFTMHEHLNNVYTNSKHKFHVAFVSNINLLHPDSGEERIRDTLLYDYDTLNIKHNKGDSSAARAIVRAARSLKHPLLLWIDVDRVDHDAESYRKLIEFARYLKQLYPNIRVIIEMSTMHAYGSSEHAQNRLLHFDFPLLNQDEILSFIDAAGGKSQKYQTEDDADDVLRITSGKPHKVLQLVAQGTKQNYLNLYQSKKYELTMFNDFGFLKDECKYENHAEIQSFYLDWNCDINGQFQNQTKSEIIKTLVTKHVIRWHDHYQKYIFVDSAIGYMLCEGDTHNTQEK